MGRPQPLQVSIPIETEVTVRLRKAITEATFMGRTEGVVIDLDVRRLNWRKRLGLPKGTEIRWDALRSTPIRELSSFLTPIQYRVQHGDGWYKDAHSGQRVTFGI